MLEERKEKIVKELKDKGVKLPCPRCEGKTFEIIDQTAISINQDLNTVKIGGPSVPAAIVACSNCGFITFHALGILNLMPNDRDAS